MAKRRSAGMAGSVAEKGAEATGSEGSGGSERAAGPPVLAVQARVEFVPLASIDLDGYGDGRLKELFDAKAIEDLAQSLRTIGQINQPVLPAEKKAPKRRGDGSPTNASRVLEALNGEWMTVPQIVDAVGGGGLTAKQVAMCASMLVSQGRAERRYPKRTQGSGGRAQEYRKAGG